MAVKNYTFALLLVAAAFVLVVAFASVGVWYLSLGADKVTEVIQPPKIEAIPLKLLVFPRTSATETLAAFGPLAERLTARLRRPVTLVTSTDFDAFWQRVAQREPDLVYYT